jgi:hypothetical protein
MKSSIKLFCFVPLLFTLFGCSGDAEANIDVEITTQDPRFGMYMVNIQAVSDLVILKSVTVNRGNCMVRPNEIEALKKQPKLKFGQVYKVWGGGCKLDQIKEVRVETDKGVFDFNFE